MEKSFVMMALRNAGRDAIQSQVSVPFNWFTINSFIENGSSLPSTDSAVRWRQRVNSLRSNVGYSTSLTRYPLPKQLAKASGRTCGPPCRDTTDAFGPATSRIFPRMVASSVALALNRLHTATQTRRNVDLSHVRTIAQICEPRSSTRYCIVHASSPTRTHKRGCGVHTNQNDRQNHSTKKPMHMDT